MGLAFEYSTYRLFAEAAKLILAGGTVHGYGEKRCSAILLWCIALRCWWWLIHLANGAAPSRCRNRIRRCSGCCYCGTRSTRSTVSHHANCLAAGTWTPGARFVQFDFYKKSSRLINGLAIRQIRQRLKISGTYLGLGDNDDVSLADSLWLGSQFRAAIWRPALDIWHQGRRSRRRLRLSQSPHRRACTVNQTKASG